ncbi:MAG TPA: hypothetical protein VMY39_01690 [Planctomycetota bacterium]|nr:hypothetical protein [Planctomycetota bacterium]
MPTPLIVIARDVTGDADRRAFEDAVVDAIEQTGGARLLVMPDASHLPAGHPALEVLRAANEDVRVYVSWLHPRAAYWLLRWIGLEGESPSCEGDCDCSSETSGRTIRTYRLGAFNSPEALVMEMPLAPGSRATTTRFPVPREVEGEEGLRPRWYPVLDEATCTVCRQCYDFCLFGVYTLDDAKRPVVTTPDACKPGCVACARLCPVGAIMFPHHEGDEGIAGAPGKRPRVVEKDIAGIFARRGEPCPVCGCACDCERSADGTAPEGKTVCPACGCLCEANVVCTCRPGDATTTGGQRDDLDDLIDELDQMDV